MSCEQDKMVHCRIILIISSQFLVDRTPSCPILEFGDFGRIMAVGQWSVEAPNWDSWKISQLAWNRKYHHPLYWKYETLAGLGRRPQGQLAIVIQLKPLLAQCTKTFQTSTCSIWTTGTRVMLVKVYFLGKGPGQGKISGLLGRIPNQGPNYWISSGGQSFRFDPLWFKLILSDKVCLKCKDNYIIVFPFY
jgi:hypothetical protein